MLTLADGGRRFDGHWIWRNVDLRLAPRDRLALVGPSGSGKTVLLRALAALDPLDEGTLELEGTPLDRWPVPEYRARVLYLPQRAALPEGPVEEHLRAPFEFAVHRDRRSFDRGRAVELLGALGRDERFLEKDVAPLSGGEQQIVALIRALLLDPAVLLLDEPAASMDDALASGAEAVVDRWVREPGTERAVVWTSHRPDRIDRVTDRRLEMT